MRGDAERSVQLKNSEPTLRRKWPSGEERYVAYLYCGLLSFVIVSYLLHQKLEFTTGAVAEIFPRSVLAGIVIYAVYRRILGELVYYPLQYLLSDWFWRVRKKAPERNSPLSYFRRKLSRHISAYELEDIHGIARYYLNLKEAAHFWDGARVELHILYLTATFGMVAAAAFAQTQQAFLMRLSSGMYALAFLFAFVADSMQHRRELYIIRAHEEAIICLIKQQMLGLSNNAVPTAMKADSKAKPAA